MDSSFKDGNTTAARSWRLWVAVLAGVLVTSVALWAAHWQHGRAQEKRALATRIDAVSAAAPLNLNLNAPDAADVFRRASAQGRFIANKAVFLDNRQFDGRVGRLVLMPLALENGGVILVLRGWVAQGAGQRAALPQVSTSSEPVSLQGVLTDHVPQFAKLNETYGAQLPALWLNFDWAAYRKASGYADLRWVLVQTSDSGDGLARRFAPPSTGVEKHLGYRLQWIAIALLSAGLTVFFGMRALLRKPIVSADS